VTVEELRRITAPFCRRFNVKRLDVFGSLARNEGTADSDVDMLVEFEAVEQHLSKRFFGLLHDLEDTLGCRVDLLTIESLKNPYFRRRALQERITLYGG